MNEYKYNENEPMKENEREKEKMHYLHKQIPRGENLRKIFKISDNKLVSEVKLFNLNII
jgi:hypothetical protein